MHAENYSDEILSMMMVMMMMKMIMMLVMIKNKAGAVTSTGNMSVHTNYNTDNVDFCFGVEDFDIGMYTYR